MKRKAITAFFLALAILLPLYAGCGEQSEGTERLSAVCTLYPQYDFVREIAGDRVELTLLLPPGTDSHSYEPSPADVIAVSKAALVFWTGEAMENWIPRLRDSVGDGPEFVDVSEGIALVPVIGHSEDDEEDVSDHEMDGHVWTNPLNCITMVETITAALSKADPANAEYYSQNALKYIERLRELDQSIRSGLEGRVRDLLVFADRCAFAYFLDEYGLTALAAFDGCSDEAEPSAKRIAELVDAVNQGGLSYVYREEISSDRIANTVSGQTKTEVLTLQTCHNLTKAEFEGNATYLSMMQDNLAKIIRGLF